MMLFNKLRSIITTQVIRNCANFVPKHDPVHPKDVKYLKDFIEKYNNIFVLTGAGISTESGIPDYRSEGVGLYARVNHKPVQFGEFIKSDYVRKRYWARNFVGWPSFSKRLPNVNHIAIRNLELNQNKVSIIVTQNVDHLHHKAGSKNIIELHGNGYTVRCLRCDYFVDRHTFQDTLKELNPNMTTEVIASAQRPDGDVDISDEQIENFVLPPCPKCLRGILQPKIVFFGDSIPRHRAAKVTNYMEDQTDALLVLGSSLTVFSSYRIILHASELNIPILIINIGATRGDPYADYKISAKCGEILPMILTT